MLAEDERAIVLDEVPRVRCDSRAGADIYLHDG